ncbi:MAG: response regulator [Deltaproteobacteria bacterium]|nr:response regulator [Deltaproteobacteria bacterium]
MAKKVLVVDDSQSVRQQVGLALEQAGYDVVEAVDGEDGASKIMSLPDLSMVISDVNMPRLNGLEMLEKVSAKLKEGLPVVMLTTEGQPALIKRAKEAGAKGWVVKPFKAAQLVATVDKLAR